ncbi:MAG: hypothetical protein GX197_08300 [Firmicutes bacterium]|nr:hypothetical protein [Bacillota bacterium]
MQDKTKQNSRELVQDVLARGVSTAIPKGELVIEAEVVKKTLGTDYVGFDELSAFTHMLHLDIFTLSPQYTMTAKELPANKEYVWPYLQQWVLETELFIFAVLDGAFEWGMRLLGLEEFFSMLRSPAALNDLLKEVENRNFYQIEKLVDEGVNGIILADDIAHQQGLFANPKILKSYFIPSLARQAEKVREMNIPVFYHSDGNYQLVFEDLVQAGFTGFQCLEKSAGMDLEKLQASFGDTLCFWGYIETDDLAAAKEEEQLQQLAAVQRNLALGNKYILGTTSGLFTGMEIEVLQKLYQML